jgi:hypothetical protein
MTIWSNLKKTVKKMKFKLGLEYIKNLHLAKEERKKTRTGKTCKAREQLKIMACSENSEQFNAIFKNKSFSESYNALKLLPCLTFFLNHTA